MITVYRTIHHTAGLDVMHGIGLLVLPDPDDVTVVLDPVGPTTTVHGDSARTELSELRELGPAWVLEEEDDADEYGGGSWVHGEPLPDGRNVV